MAIIAVSLVLTALICPVVWYAVWMFQEVSAIGSSVHDILEILREEKP
jgi:hypothetical protein